MAGAGHIPRPSQLVAALRTPLVHDCNGPQDVLGDLFVVSLQAIVPVEQEVVPFLHGLFGWHGWLGVHAPHVPDLQKRLVPHIAPSTARAQAPIPSQVPVWQLAEAQAESVVPRGLLLHVPGVPMLQAWHAGQLALPQQTPLTQFPEMHSVPSEHTRPVGFFAWQRPPLQ